MTAVGWDPDEDDCTGTCCQTPTDTAPGPIEPPDWPSFVHQLTSEQRGRMQRAMANVTKGLQQFAKAFEPAGRRADQGLAQIADAHRYEPKPPRPADD